MSPKFISQRQLNLFNSLNKQLINDIIDTRVNIYKINAYQTEANLYGQALKKIYYPNVSVSGLVDHSQPQITSTEFGMDYSQDIQVRFQRLHLKQIDLYIQIGDVIE